MLLLSCFSSHLPTNKKQYIPNKSMAGLRNTAHFARCVRGIFDNEEKIGEE
jgi:hypothetical protein